MIIVGDIERKKLSMRFRPTIFLIPLDKCDEAAAQPVFRRARDVTVLNAPPHEYVKKENKFKLKKNEKHLFLFDELVILYNLSAVKDGDGCLCK
jgi:hypothetical protein